jgi:nucleoid-associated protein EbfC
MANIFSQAKDLYKMQKQAREMQNKMKQVEVSGYSKDELIEVIMNGVNEMVSIDIDVELLAPAQKQKLERSIVEATKDAAKKLQKELMKDMDMDKMKSMLGM